LEWARQSNAWIIEDDYDSEYRYTGRPLPALQGLDTAGRVIYVGTFSKVLFPALRLGYVVVPDDLVNAFASARVITDDHPPILEQLVVTQFITEGHFARHIRRMRTLYAERQATLLAEGRVLEGLVELVPSEAGLHLVGWLPHGADDGQVARLALRAGVDTAPLTDFYQHKPERGGLTFGFAAYDQPDMHAGMTALRGALS
jgi:GntR family transcriptional regulator/MocR family aminotransferase